MKISFVMSNCPRKPTGGHKVVFEYMNYLSKHNEVVVYFGYDEAYGSFHIPSFLKRFLAKNATRLFRPNWFALDKRIKKYCVDSFDNERIIDADVVVATDVKTAFPVFELNCNKGKKYYFIQDFENWLVSDEFVKQTYYLDMRKIVVSKWLKELIVSLTGEQNIICVSNSINTDIFNDKKIGRKNHSVVFQYRSNIDKGCTYALEVIEKLKTIYNDLSVTIISNERKPDFIPDWCEYHYNVPILKVAELNNTAQVFMCTSLSEGFGLPGLEAMACGCALVSTSYKGVLEYAVDGENALLSPVKDVDHIVENIVKLFENDQLRQQIVNNGIKTGKERSLEKASKEFENALLM